MHLGEFMTSKGIDSQTMNDYIFYFFDVDEDCAPELCVKVAFAIYILKYVPNLDEFILWKELESNSYQIIGSKKIFWNHIGSGTGLAFYKLDDSGEYEYSTFFYSSGKYNEVVYLVTLPIYAGNVEKMEITERTKNEAYKDRDLGRYYFRVTEEQYSELTKNYFEAEKIAREDIKRVTFTYEELFRNLFS